MRARTLKRLLLCIVLAFLGVMAWLTILDVRPIDVHSRIDRSPVIAYGRFVAGGSRSQVVIEQVWKHPGAGAPVSVGSSVSYSVPSDTQLPDGAVIFFSLQPISRKLSADATMPVYGERVPGFRMSLSELKALCEANPST